MMRKRVTQVDLAELLGLHIDTIGKKINGESTFTIDEAEKIWRVYFSEMDFWWLFRTDCEQQSA